MQTAIRIMSIMSETLKTPESEEDVWDTVGVGLETVFVCILLAYTYEKEKISNNIVIIKILKLVFICSLLKKYILIIHKKKKNVYINSK